MLSVNGISILYLSVSFVSSHFHPNQASISHFILISQLPQPIIISPVCVSQCLLLSLYFTLDLSPCDLFSSPYSISLFHLVLFSCFFLPIQYILIPFCTNNVKKNSRISANAPLKLLLCTFSPPKSKKFYKITHPPPVSGMFLSSSPTSQILTVW